MVKHRNQEVPGNVLATAAMTERILQKTGYVVHQSGYRMEAMEEEGIEITRISFKARGGPSGEWLAVVTAATENGSVVAFYSADSYPAAVEGVANKLMNGSFKWKEDQYG